MNVSRRAVQSWTHRSVVEHRNVATMAMFSSEGTTDTAKNESQGRALPCESNGAPKEGNLQAMNYQSWTCSHWRSCIDPIKRGSEQCAKVKVKR